MKPMSFEAVGSVQKLPEDLSRAEIDQEEYRENAQAFLDKYSRTGFFASFSGDTSIHFKLSNGFYFDFQKGEVHLATEWFYEKGFSEKQILWACMHEIGHFDDFKNDPERLMKNFAYIADQARETGEIMLKKWEEVLDISDPKQKAYLDSLKQTTPVNSQKPEMGSFNRLAQSAYGIHHPFYNSLDDIWVNNWVSRKAATFEKGTEGGKEIEALYKDKLFPGFDYSKGESRHRQFINKLLRDDNVPDEKCIVSSDVEEILNRKIRYVGKSYTVSELIESFIKPRRDRDTKAGERYSLLKRTIEPLFKELLHKDLDEWKPEWKPPQEEKKNDHSDKGEKEKGDMQENEEQNPPSPFEDEIKSGQENTIDQLPPEAMKEFFDKFQEVAKEKEEKQKKEDEEKRKEKERVEQEEEKSSEQKMGEMQRKQDEEWASMNASSKHSKEELLENLAEFRQVQAEIAPYLDELSSLWRHIIFGTSRETVRGMEGYFKTGDELDVQKTIEDWGDIQDGKFDQTRIFKRIDDREIVTQKPERIRVRIAGDMSASMKKDKLRILQQAMTLIFSSLDEFQTYLNSTRSETKSVLQVETEGWVFSGSGKRIKSFEDRENTQMVSIFNELQDAWGGTNDDIVLAEIDNSLTPEDEEGIQAGKIMDIVFEITDGGSSRADEAKEAVDMLNRKGFITKAFQIGVAGSLEDHIFNRVWNEGRDKKCGIKVGSDIRGLIPAITKALKEYLGDVAI